MRPEVMPTVGRVVLFRSRSPSEMSMAGRPDEVPAIVTYVNGVSTGSADLTVLRSGMLATPMAFENVPYDESGHGSGWERSWRWPPRS